MAETLASFVPATAVPRSTVHREVVLGRVGWCGWWEMMSTLLDPEGTTMTAREGRAVCPGREGRGCCFSTARPGLVFHTA